MRGLILLIAVAAISASGTPALARLQWDVKSPVPRQCKHGVPCGNACISKAAVCHVRQPRAPYCKTGKPCGDTCIKATDTCHKP